MAGAGISDDTGAFVIGGPGAIGGGLGGIAGAAAGRVSSPPDGVYRGERRRKRLVRDVRSFRQGRWHRLNWPAVHREDWVPNATLKRSFVVGLDAYGVRCYRADGFVGANSTD